MVKQVYRELALTIVTAVASDIVYEFIIKPYLTRRLSRPALL